MSPDVHTYHTPRKEPAQQKTEVPSYERQTAVRKCKSHGPLSDYTASKQQASRDKVICCLSEFVFPLPLPPTELCVGGGPVQRAEGRGHRERGRRERTGFTRSTTRIRSSTKPGNC